MIDCNITTNYLSEKQKMTKRQKHKFCGIKCADCPLNDAHNGEGITCNEFEVLYPEKAIAIVQKWSDEHPPKTYLSEFLKNYPNAPLNNNGTPDLICLYDLGLMSYDDGIANCDNCVKCWNQFIPIKDGEE